MMKQVLIASFGTMSLLTFALVSAFTMGGCQPKLQIVAPDKPIVINLNVKIDQEVRVRLDKDVEDLIANNPDLF